MDDSRRLERFEQMLHDVESELDEIDSQIPNMKTKGQSKSATFKQLLARRLTLKQILSIYERYGLR